MAYSSQHIATWMKQLKINPEDIVEQFTRSSAKGGQNVNKVETCVILTHVPSGITVRCEKERAQALNRQLAKELLLKKIEEARINFQRKQKEEREKKRRQNRKRPEHLKKKILESKRMKSQKKALRRKTGLSDE